MRPDVLHLVGPILAQLLQRKHDLAQQSATGLALVEHPEQAPHGMPERLLFQEELAVDLVDREVADEDADLREQPHLHSAPGHAPSAHAAQTRSRLAEVVRGSQQIVQQRQEPAVGKHIPVMGLLRQVHEQHERVAGELVVLGLHVLASQPCNVVVEELHLHRVVPITEVHEGSARVGCEEWASRVQDLHERRNDSEANAVVLFFLLLVVPLHEDAAYVRLHVRASVAVQEVGQALHVLQLIVAAQTLPQVVLGEDRPHHPVVERPRPQAPLLQVLHDGAVVIGLRHVHRPEVHQEAQRRQRLFVLSVRQQRDVLNHEVQRKLALEHPAVNGPSEIARHTTHPAVLHLPVLGQHIAAVALDLPQDAVDILRRRFWLAVGLLVAARLLEPQRAGLQEVLAEPLGVAIHEYPDNRLQECLSIVLPPSI
mmetsp:Transcript_49084/g.146646  ORF Transcript_49084/g.146646 Transcript_49084/m.146646 type:complete len:426 (-) Transcript_49084:340-1617(-)